MKEATGEMDADISLSTRDAYLAMVEFVRDYMTRAPGYEVELVYNDISPDFPMDPSHDPAMWSDWLKAVRVTQNEVVSESDHGINEWRQWEETTVAEELLARGIDAPITDVMIEQVVYRRVGFGWLDTNRELAIGVATELLFEGLAIAGDRDVDRWELPTSEAVERLAKRWLKAIPGIGHDIGEIVILHPTEAGQALGAEVLARHT